MGILKNLEASGKPQRSGPKPGFASAEFSRLTSSLASESQYINLTLRNQLRTLRARSRQAAQNNPFARRFVSMVVDNVAGDKPFRLQAKNKFGTGRIDDQSNSAIENAWECWSRRGNCEVTGRFAWNALQRLLIRTLAIDGEVLLRKYKGPEWGPHGYQLQLVDIDRLWEMKNAALPNGGAINMGIEMDSMSRPVAYHILKRKPSAWAYGYSMETDRVDASEIIHLFIPDFAEQARGVPWMYAALLNLVHLGAFEEAAVIAARVGAAQMGFIQSPDGGENLVGDGKDAKGNTITDAEAGMFTELPPGYQVAGWNPKYPDAAVEPFIKACLRGVGAGLNVAYHNLANDLENVNYSSARIGELDERDSWMGIQGFVIDHLHQPLYDEWLPMQIMMNKLPFNLGKIDKYNCVYWQPRRWQWVDPLKETTANIDAINSGLKSRTRVIAEQGDDIEDVFDEIQQEQQLAKEKKIDLTTAKPTPASITPTNGAQINDETSTDQTDQSGN